MQVSTARREKLSKTPANIWNLFLPSISLNGSNIFTVSYKSIEMIYTKVRLTLWKLRLN